MSKAILAAALALLLALAAPARAVPVVPGPAPWHPGGAPCAGACKRDAALAKMVAAGVIPPAVARRIRSGRVSLRPVTIRSGDVLRSMTWAVDGRPEFSPRAFRAETGGAVLVADAYRVRVGRTIYEVMKVRLCRNWTTRRVPAPAGASPPLALPPAAWRSSMAPASIGGFAGGGIDAGDECWIVRACGACRPGEPGVPGRPVAPVPLPPALPALLAALTGLAWIGRARATATRRETHPPPEDRE